MKTREEEVGAEEVKAKLLSACSTSTAACCSSSNNIPLPNVTTNILHTHDLDSLKLHSDPKTSDEPRGRRKISLQAAEVETDDKVSMTSHNSVIFNPDFDRNNGTGVMKMSPTVQELHPHQLLSVHRKSISVMENGCNGSNNGGRNEEHKKSMVEEMLEDFPDINDDDDYSAKFTEDVNMSEIICLDVGGDRYHVRRGCLTRLPNTRLGRLARCASLEDAKEFCDIVYDKTPMEYFFDRNGDNFSSILGKFRAEFRNHGFLSSFPI